MKLRLLAGKEVNPIGFGGMALDEYKPKPSDENAIELLKYAVNSGVNLIDTADVYGLGRNEELIGRALNEAQKKEVIIATKGGCIRPGGYGWDTDGSPAHLKKTIMESLKRLGLKQIFLYQLHAPDYRVPFESSIIALKELQEQGYIKHIGLCNVNLGQLEDAEKIVKVESVQNHFNLYHKMDEQELLPYLSKNKIAFLPYFPLGSGELLKEKRLISMSRKLNLTPAQICLAWILKWPNAIPIPGTRSKEHFNENMKAAEISLSEDAIEELDNLY